MSKFCPHCGKALADSCCGNSGGPVPEVGIGFGNYSTITAKLYKMEVYMDDGRVFEYYVDSPGKGREHAGAIVQGGYRHTPQNGLQFLEWYPPHRIVKVKVEDGGAGTVYKDTLRAT